jgi:DNA-directed RNA polymerase subunit E"
MAKKEACKRCKYFFDGETCPICSSSSKTSTWQGRLFIGDAERSMIAEKVGIKAKGEYAIKVR